MKAGDDGAEVGKLQQALLEAGESLGLGETKDMHYGPATAAAVRHYQSHHVDADGHALAEDGVAGPKTLWSLAHGATESKGFTAPGWRFRANDVPANARMVLEAAVGEIGVHEVPDGSNRVPGDRYKSDAPDGTGQPWCAFFVSWAYGHADGGSPFKRMGGVYSLQEWAKKNGRLVTSPRPGDVWVIFRGNGHGHTGLVAGTLPGNRMCTVEGNAGNAVRGLVRDIQSVSYFFRPLA